MKPSGLIKLSLVFMLLTAVHTTEAQKRNSKKGPGGTGGGDEFTLDFLSTTEEALALLLQTPHPHQSKIDAAAFREAVKAPRIESVDKVFESCDNSQKGREVTFCYNKNLDFWQISRTRYPLNMSSVAKIKGVAHEVLRKLGLEGDDYEITRHIIPESVLQIPTATTQLSEKAEAIPATLVKNYLSAPTPSSSPHSAYSSLAESLRGAALKRQQYGEAILKQFDAMVEKWLKEKMARSRNGVIEIDLGPTNSRYGFAGQDLWYGVSNHYAENWSSYQSAYTRALNTSLQATGLGVISIGSRTSERTYKDASPSTGAQTGYAGTTSFAFIGKTPGAEVKIANYAFKVLSFADGIEAMGKMYTAALKDLENEYLAELTKGGVSADSNEYFKRLNDLYRSAQLEFKVTMFQDATSEQEFLKDLEQIVAKAQALDEKTRLQNNNLKAEFSGGAHTILLRQWTCRYVNVTNPDPATYHNRRKALAVAQQNCINAAEKSNLNLQLCSYENAICSRD